eukprot:5590469-Ditylum_brightwellii.AAC.1
MAQVWKKIGHAGEKHEAGSIPSLLIPVTWPPSDCVEDQISALDNLKKAQRWRTIETPREIALYLKLCNRLHFGQVKGTPFTIPPLSEEFDWAENSQHYKLVLEGSYSNLELTFLENKLLGHCKKKRKADIMGNEIAVEEWKEKSGFGKNEQQLLHPANILGITKHSLAEAQTTHSKRKKKFFMTSNKYWSKL